jgi:hypothetical protein
MADPKPKKRDPDERVAIPLDPELAMRALLAVDPHSDAARDALVDEMERESFPASDPPSTWAGPSSAA